MEPLGKIIKEISLSNELQLNAYNDVVSARVNIEKSIRQSQIEYSETEKKLNKLYKKGKRNADGILIDKLTIYQYSVKHKAVMKKSMETLERIQELERMMLAVLNAKNINFIDADDVEERAVIFSR